MLFYILTGLMIYICIVIIIGGLFTKDEDDVS